MIDTRVTDLLYDWAVGRLSLPEVERRAAELAYGPAFGVTEPGQQTPELQVLLSMLIGFYDREIRRAAIDGAHHTETRNTTIYIPEAW